MKSYDTNKTFKDEHVKLDKIKYSASKQDFGGNTAVCSK